MCLPLLRNGHLQAILYLENNLSETLFTHDRLPYLEAIGSQLLISIDNARLHEGLENLVERRTHELEEANRHLRQQTLLDGLTGIGNRRRFDETVAVEWLRAQRNQSPLSICLIDVDFFKRYNDFYGHIAGDDCLKQVAQTLHMSIKRSADSVNRYGGEEFVILLPETTSVAAKAIAERCRRAVEALALPHAQSEASSVVSISVGIACANSYYELTSAEALVHCADAALYRAKMEGRNRVICYVPPQ
ncbi:MAG: diguanylate cyclase [Hahellaceae bacterium]|nr:diguanylate cyclase [Hahellaceae bacterium]